VTKFLNAQEPQTLAAAEAELSTKLQESAVNFAKNNVAANHTALAAVKTTASTELDRANKAIEAKGKEEDALDEQIRKREDTQEGRQDRVSKNLQPIFWGIMGAILVTMIVLRVRSDEQSLLMVRERTAVEMLSIGMFLMTILFLGTGEFLQKETLGTLLGTLAGYLFTRRASEQRQEKDVSSTSIEAPAKPTIDDGGKTIAISLPKGADYLSVFARDLGTGAEHFLGATSEPRFDLTKTALAKGNQYAVWLVAHGPGGASRPSASQLITL
jgi:hypothetical protein